MSLLSSKREVGFETELTMTATNSESSDKAAGNDFIGVLNIEDLLPGGQKLVWLGITRVLLCHTGSAIYAVADMCSHALQPLYGGVVEHDIIRCPKHGARFSLLTGAPVNGLTDKPLSTFEVRLTGTRIEIRDRRT